MNLTEFTFQSFRLILLPFSLLYAFVVWLRNKCYDKGWLSSVSFNLPVICIGNLSVGGTGKSPMIEHLIRLLQDQYELAVLSRGYKRRTKGYVLAGNHTTALEIGDEPMQFRQKFPKLAVAVGESRVEAIPQLLQDRPRTELVLLDDAFQHRTIKPGLSILLTEAQNLFTRDFPLPTGDLRDIKSSYVRADIIVVTKCQADLSDKESIRIREEIRPLPHQDILFATLEYGSMYHILDARDRREFSPETGVLLVTGIANPKPLKQLLEKQRTGYEYLSYSDHHIFTIDDLRAIRQRFMRMEEKDKVILTTEKDAVRLIKFKKELADLPLYVLPVNHRFLFGGEQQMKKRVFDYLAHFIKSSNDSDQILNDMK